MRKLSKDEVKRYREMLLVKQGGKCRLCDQTITDKMVPSLDHCHKTGLVRGVLCKKCNLRLGKVEAGMFNWRTPFLKKAILYINEKHEDVVHPSGGAGLGLFCSVHSNRTE